MASYITGLVLEKKDTQFIETGAYAGSLMQVPTPDNGAVVDGNYWAVPVNDGVYAAWTFVPYNASNPLENVAPNPYSVAVVKISQNNGSDWFYVLGTAAQYVTAAAGGTALPAVWTNVVHTVPELPVCQALASVNPTSGLYEITIGVPSLAVGNTLFAFGFFNGFALTALNTAGYASVTTLIAAMNTNWSAAVGGTFTKTGDDLTVILTQTAGAGTDVFCGGILAINPSA